VFLVLSGMTAFFSVFNLQEQFGNIHFPQMHSARAVTGRGKASECIACSQ